jgi:hypothetical protein
MSKIENRRSEGLPEPHEDVVAEACKDTRVLQDDELEAVAGGHMRWTVKPAFVTSYS